MAVSTQPYIELTEATVFNRTAAGMKVVYPSEFNKEFAELIGIVISVGRLTRSSSEINFADCWIYPNIPKRVKELYEQHWVGKPIRNNSNGQPRICGRKYVAFISYICGGDEYLKPNNEKIPRFIQYSEPEVIRGFLRGVLAASPKIKRNDGSFWLLLRNLQFVEDINKLIEQVLDCRPWPHKTFLVFNATELQILKDELDLNDSDWWTCAAEWYFRKKTFNQQEKDEYYARRRLESERKSGRKFNSEDPQPLAD